MQSPVSHNITNMQVRCSDDNDKSEATAYIGTPDTYSTEEMRQCHSKDREAQSRINKGEIEAVRRGSMMVNNEIKRTFMYPPLKHMHTHEHTNICVRIQNDCCGSWRRSGFKNVGRDVKLLLYASIDSSLIHL